MQFFGDTTRNDRKSKGIDDGNFTRVSFGAQPRKAQPGRFRAAAGGGHCGHPAACRWPSRPSLKTVQKESEAAAGQLTSSGMAENILAPLPMQGAGPTAQRGRAGRSGSGRRQRGQHRRTAGAAAVTLETVRPGPADRGRPTAVKAYDSSVIRQPSVRAGRSELLLPMRPSSATA